jgi:photosystem II stability/assembly factor-like uncharacterized protein
MACAAGTPAARRHEPREKRDLPGDERVPARRRPDEVAKLAYASNSKLYVGNEAPIGTPVRVIKSLDGGATWTVASTGLPPVPTTKLIVSPRDPSGNTVYAGTWLGVYETTDGGASWHPYGSGLPMVVVSDLYMPTDGSYLRVATYGRGVWEMRSDSGS